MRISKVEKIAIIGLSCLFPDAHNPEEFWQNLTEEKDSTSSITIAAGKPETIALYGETF